MQHDDLRELVTAYVLDTASPDERRLVERHLDLCPECTGEAASLGATVAELGFAVPALRAPRELRARVLSAVERTPLLEFPGQARPAGLSQRGSPWWLTVAAMLSAIIVGGYAVVLRSRVVFLDHEVREALAQAQSAQRQLLDVQGNLGRARTELQRVSLTTSILASPDVVRVDLKGAAAASSAVGHAFWSRSRGMLFTSHALPSLPASQVYQLWIVTASGPLSRGLLSPDAEGRALVVADAAPSDAPKAFAVTVEPAGGVAAPTSAPILIGAL